MTYAIEIYLSAAASIDRVNELTKLIESLGGRLQFRESAGLNNAAPCLTFEFDTLPEAEAALALIEGLSAHSEGPFAYGEDPEQVGGGNGG